MAQAKSSDQNKSYLLIILLALLALGWFFFAKDFFSKKQLHTSEAVTAFFDCGDSKSITAVFSGNIVSLDLSDGRQMVLDHAIHAAGAKYANRDESSVFWNRGKTAFIKEGNTTTFRNCVQH